MTRSHIWIRRGSAPRWLALAAVLPLTLLFLVSLALAGGLVVGGALLAALVLPRLARKTAPRDDGTIELERSDYKRLQ